MVTLDHNVLLVSIRDEESIEYKFEDFTRNLPTVRILLEEAAKLEFLMNLLENFKLNGHRCLIFSQSRKMLNIIQKVLIEKVSYGLD